MKRPGWMKGGTQVRVRGYFEPRDLWRGVYWNYDPAPMKTIDGYAVPYAHMARARLTLYICIIPTLVIRIDLAAKAAVGDRERQVGR